MVVAIHFRESDLTKLSAVDNLSLGIHQMRRTATLHTDLNDTTVLSSGSQHRVPFHDIHANRLLQIKVGAGFHRLDRRQRVPVIGRPDEHNVVLLVLQHLAIVGVLLRFHSAVARKLLDDPRCFVQHIAIDVANRNHVDVVRLDLNQPQQVTLAIPPRTNQTDLASLAGFCGGEFRCCGCYGSSRGSGLQESSAIHNFFPN